MSRPANGGSGLILGLLLAAYTLNFLDRQIVGILKIPIKAELGLSDTQLGLMGGIAFASVYSTLAIPFARYADRKGRARVIVLAIATWSLFTGLCGLVTSFWQLFVARMGVGVGEAGGVAPSYALIAQHVAPERRARALAIFFLGIPIGSALALFFGGWLAEAVDWRAAFVVIGAAGLPVAWLIARYVPDAAPDPAAGAAPFFQVLAELAAKPSFWLLSLGAASGSICGYGFGFWLPSFFSENLGLSLTGIGAYYGSIVLVGGAAGIWLASLVSDRLGAARSAAYPAVPGVAFLLSVPAYFVAMSSASPGLAWLLFAFAQALSLAWLGPITTAVQGLVAPSRRATASACFLLFVNLIGIGFGTFVFGFAADRLRPAYGADAMRIAILDGLGFYVLAALLCGLAAITIGRDAESPNI
ncbi:spinster family MFS transporter [Sphingomonas sp. URHD0057]|uniref:spinster family MFS transporter n=1 Tax=Sphingomonas sp. URHD0057 TaxID=1380389 RepID=UPI000563C034|nr:MFS transporter [Sphingomonas sp. URHD0057]